jgi:hypothetical protein
LKDQETRIIRFNVQRLWKEAEVRHIVHLSLDIQTKLDRDQFGIVEISRVEVGGVGNWEIS